MDPLSVSASLAGVATAGVAISSALFDLVAAYRSAPREISEMARGISDMSLVLDQLVDVLRRGKRLYRRKLLRAVDSAVQRIDDVHCEIWMLIDISGNKGLGRVMWVFRRAKTQNLLFKIEAHKATLQIITTTLLLAMEQRKYLGTENKPATDPSSSRPDRATRQRLRRQAETLVQSAHQSLRDLAEDQTFEDKTNVTSSADPTTETNSKLSDGERRKEDIDITSEENRDNQVKLYGHDKDDTGLWLYRTVFSGSAQSPIDELTGPNAKDSATVVFHDIRQLKMTVRGRDRVTRVVDDLLSDWTKLDEHEIEATTSMQEQSAAKPLSPERPGPSEGASSTSDIKPSFATGDDNFDLNKGRAKPRSNPHTTLESETRAKDSTGAYFSGKYTPSGINPKASSKLDRRRSREAPRMRATETVQQTPEAALPSGAAEVRRKSFVPKPGQRSQLTSERRAPSFTETRTDTVTETRSWTESSSSSSNDGDSHTGSYDGLYPAIGKLVDVPFGHSAFSELDFPIGARKNKPPRVQRNPSFKAAPKILKKVVGERKKKTTSQTDPPTPVVSQPPSLESWLENLVRARWQAVRQ